MKKNGKEMQGAGVEYIVIPRQQESHVFTCKAVLAYEDFEKLCPMPEAPIKILPGGEEQRDVERPEFKEKVNAWAGLKIHWMVLQSLKATEWLSWDTVDPSNPQTWGNYEVELGEAGFTPAEITRIIGVVISVCGLNQDKIDEATESFLAEMQG